MLQGAISSEKRNDPVVGDDIALTGPITADMMAWRRDEAAEGVPATAEGEATRTVTAPGAAQARKRRRR